MKNKKDNNSKKPCKKQYKEKDVAKKDITMHMFSLDRPKLELDDKKIKAIKTIMDDPVLRYKDHAELKSLIEGYEAGKKTEKGDKK